MRASQPALVYPGVKELARSLTACAEPRFLTAPCLFLRTGTRGPWLLVSQALARLDRSPVSDAAVLEVEVELEAGRVHLPGKRTYRIEEHHHLPTPWMAVPPRPWSQEPEYQAVAVVLPDEVAFRRAVEALLVLGHDRLWAARLGTRGVLLLVESPSFFLVQRWFEEEGRSVYWRESGGDVLMPWGQVHPLRRRMRGLDLGERLYLLEPGGSWSHFERSQLQDVYQGLHFDLDRVVEARLPTVAEVPRVEVTLGWGHRTREDEATLWVLPSPGEEVVQGLLDELPEVALAHLQLAVVRGEEGGEDLFLIRRFGGGRRRRGTEVPGEPYAPYAGYGNLFLPRGACLEPPIRKERFRSLLALVPGELVLLSPGPEGEVRVRRLEEAAFRSLESLVDYRISGAEDRLGEILASTVFEFEPLEYLPVRDPDRVSSGSGERREDGEVPEEIPPLLEPERPVGPPPRRPEAGEPPPDEPPRAEDEEDVAPPPEQHRGPDPRELELQDRALEVGDAASWLALAEYQRHLGKADEALYSYEEVLWRSDALGAAPVRRAYREHLEELLELGEAPSRERFHRAQELLWASPERPDRVTLYLGYRLADLPPGEELREALGTCYRALREHPLRRKAGWLAWSEVLAVSRDLAEEERQREATLGALSRRGLDPEDRPDFLGRYLRQRAGLTEWADHVDLPTLLDLLERAARSIAPGPFRTEARALFLRTCLEADREGQGNSLLGEFAELLDEESDASLVARAHHAGALGSSRPEEARKHFRSLIQALRERKNPKDRLFHHLFQNLVFAESFSGVQELLPEALDLLASLGEAHRSRILAEVAPQLVELGARRELVRMSRELLAHPRVAEDLFLVEHVARCLELGLHPERPSDQDWARLGDCLAASDERYKILYLDLLEEVVGALGAGFVDRLEALEEGGEGGQGGEYSRLVLTACRVKLLAEEGASPQGLALVEQSLPRCWELPSDECVRALGRFLRAIAYLGNAPRGSELLHQVVEKAYSVDDPAFKEFHRGEVLGEVARAIGELGDPARAVSLMTRILEGVEARLDGANDSVGLLFEVLTRGIEVLLELGEWRSAGPLVARIEKVVGDRVDAREGIQQGPWFYLHRARVTCARALLYMGRDQEGGRALEAALRGFQRVSTMDRTDLLEEAAGVLAYLDGQGRLAALGAMIEVLEKTEDMGEFDRRRRGEVVQALATAVRPGVDAYRREQGRWDALEARSIRRRVATSRPSEGRTGKGV